MFKDEWYLVNEIVFGFNDNVFFWCVSLFGWFFECYIGCMFNLVSCMFLWSFMEKKFRVEDLSLCYRV